MLQTHELTKTYRGPDGLVPAVQGCSLEVAAGEIVVVRGRSGSGKSTLLGMIACLIRPDSGRLVVGEKTVSSWSDSALSDLRATAIGVVFQAFHLLPHLTAVQNIALAASGRPAHAEARAVELLETFGLADRARHRPGEMSGGEQQRIAVARALVNQPALLVADEPTGNLDAASEELVLQQLRSAAHNGCAVLVCSHSETVSAVGDRVVLMDQGRLLPWQATTVTDRPGARGTDAKQVQP